MKNGLKRIITLLLSGTLMVTMAGCKQNDKQDVKSGEKQTSVAKGRYVEEEVNLPADLSGGGKVCAIENLEDNSLRVIAGNKSNPVQVYSSKDDGKTWDKVNVPPSVIPPGNRLRDAAIDKKGNMIISYGVPFMSNGVETLAVDGKISYIKLGSDGKSAPLNVELPSIDKKINDGINSLHSLKIASNGDLWGIDTTGKLLQIDSTTGKIKNTYTSKNTLYQYAIVENTLFAVTNKAVEQYDVTSGKQSGDIKVLADYLSAKETGADAGKENKCLLISGSDGKGLYFCNDQGLYHHTLNGSIVEQLMDGTLVTLSSIDVSYMNIVAKQDNNFFILYKINDTKFSLMKYSYSKTVSAVPKNEITVYSLRDNRTIRQEITLFQKANPDIHVVFETGLSEKDAVSVQDALKTLNTEILAGKGPDILVLDDMPLASYMDKGILGDLSGVLGDYIKKGELFENITGAYKNKNKIYAAPIRFEIPVINAKQDTLDQIKDLKTLADYTVKFREKNTKDLIFDMYSSDILIRPLFSVNGDSWINKDGTLDENKLSDFFNLTKQIYDSLLKAKAARDNMEAYNYKVSLIAKAAKGSSAPRYRTDAFNSFWPFDVVDGRVNLSLGSISIFKDLTYLSSAHAKDPSVNYRPINTDKGYFIPLTNIGINAKNGSNETAKKFISYLFSKEGQEVNVDLGFPVNKAVFESGKKETDLTEERSALGDQYKLVWPTDQQFKDFTQMVEGLKTPIYNNNVILDAVLEVSDKCMKGEMPVKDAVTAVMKKVNLYLSE